MEPATHKTCCVCGADVAGRKRTKDAAGNYYCQPCYTSQMQAVQQQRGSASVASTVEPELAHSETRAKRYSWRAITIALVATALLGTGGLCWRMIESSNRQAESRARIAAIVSEADKAYAAGRLEEASRSYGEALAIAEQNRVASDPTGDIATSQQKKAIIDKRVEDARRLEEERQRQREDAERTRTAAEEEAREIGTEDVFTAVHRNHLDRVEQLLTAIPSLAREGLSAKQSSRLNVDLHLEDMLSGDVPIQHANSAEMVDLLMRHGASVDETGARGRTALELAAEAGNMKLADALIKHGADVNAGSYSTPLGWCCKPKDGRLTDESKAMIRFLVSRGANLNLCRGGIDHLPLCTVAATGNVADMEFLIGLGSDPSVSEQPTGLTPYRCAVENGKTEAATFLLAKLAERNKR